MAAVRSRVQLPVGSAQWINDENNQVAQFCAQETEDFVFSARNEVEWLNEHMAEIFSKNQVNVTEIFKTPGKLRGKTPRTARKRNPLEAREPLTDIFSTNARSRNSPVSKASPIRSAPTFQVAEDAVAPTEFKRLAKVNTDSGYHGLSEDDMEIDEVAPVVQSSAETHETIDLLSGPPLAGQAAATNRLEGSSTGETSFHSAREEVTKQVVVTAALLQGQHPQVDVSASASSTNNEPAQTEAQVLQHDVEDAMDLDIIEKELDEDLVVDESRSPSQGSSPARPLVRKSSLTFAALPAREPLTTKKSLGARASRTSHLDHSKAPVNRGSFLGRLTGGKSLGGSKQPESTHEKEANDEKDTSDTDKPTLTREESDGDSKMFKLHNKSSTQRLHDRINMLGKSQNARPTKSIPPSTNAPNTSYPQLPIPEPQPPINLQSLAAPSEPATVPVSKDEDDDEDWIQAPQLQQSASNRPLLPKSVSADVMEGIRGKHTIGCEDFDLPSSERQATKQASPLRHVNPTQVNSPRDARARSAIGSASPSRANARNAADTSTTPRGSPSSSKRYVDGPLSASKSKLQSIMKTARGLFSSSAGVSAQAKMETLSPPSMRLYDEPQGPSISSVLDSKTSGNEGKSRSPMINPAGRKTRSSTEKEERRKQSEAKERQRAETRAERAHEQQSQNELAPEQMAMKGQATDMGPPPAKATRQSPRKTQTQEPSKPQVDIAGSEQPLQSTGPPQQSQLQKKEPRRPIKPAKEAGPKPKPQPVAIRVGTLSQGLRMNNTALASNLQESLPAPQPRPPAMAKKPSNASIQSTASNNSFKSSVTSAAAKPKALIAAERKKEQDEREAQRKLEQKRDMERKRAAQQEEARRHEQLQRLEAERQRERERSAAAEDPKNIAKRQAIEKRRMEMQRKDQQRAPQRPDNAPVPHQTQTAPTTRQELGGPRPSSRLQTLPDHNKLANNLPMHNPTKAAIKRVFDPDDEDEPPRPVRMQGGPPYQQNDAKRRRTEDEELQEIRVRPTMAPPIRQSGIRQGGPKASIFNNSYSTAPPPAPHHNAPSLLKSTTANQAYQQHAHQTQPTRPGHHPDMAKYQNGKIPFADVPNPPQQSHKTPLHSKLALPAKSSPQYINGENIHLDDIPTESEDESDSDSGSKPKPANLPEWAQSPQLRQLLMTQDENMDADAVFGPVPSPRMEEMFRERHHRFRSRTSSANWAGSDRLTDEEIRKDVEARQRLRREGGWTFGL